MVQNSLVRYIREQIRQGYDISSIKGYLLRYGYPEGQINEALQFAYPPTEVRHVLHPSKTTIALIVAAVCSLILISAAVFMFLGSGKTPKQLLDVKIELVSSSVEYGSNLMFTVELFNLGKIARYDVSLRHEIYNLRDEFVIFKEETIALETRASSSVSLSLGGTPPGSYYVKTTAFYGGKSAKATSSFRIVKKGEIPTEEPKEEPEEEPVRETMPEITRGMCPISCSDGDSCTRDYCNEGTNYECRHDKMFPCCGNGVCESSENYNNCLADCEAPADQGEGIFEGKTIWEKVEMIADIAKRDKEGALRYCEGIEQTNFRYDCFTKVAASSKDDGVCEKIEDEAYKDYCYRNFANENRNSEVCAKVIKESKRDQCYMDFATKGDYSVCDKLVNKYLRQSCESLKRLSEVEIPS